MTAATRLADALGGDDIAGLFRTIESGVGGRFVRLGDALDAILSAHNLTEPAAHALGELLVLAALLGADLTDGAQLILQTQTDGAVPVIVADVASSGDLRGYAQSNLAANDESARPTAAEPLGLAALRGAGRLAITLRSDAAATPYQSIVALDDGRALDAAVADYFANREGVATLLRLVVSRTMTRQPDGSSATSWRGGGFLLQKPAGGADSDDGHATNQWDDARILAETIEDHELVDPALPADRLLMRLFHEEGVQVTRVGAVRAKCRCTRDRIANVLKSFGSADLDDMRADDGSIEVTCEFCAKQYRFAAGDI